MVGRSINRLSAVIWFAAIAGLSQAGLYTFNYSDSDGNAGHGFLKTEYFDFGVERAIDGWMQVTAGTRASTAPYGLYAAFDKPFDEYPNSFLSPNEFFYYDNLVMPGKDPLITFAGLLFVNTAQKVELAVYSDTGTGTYGFIGCENGSYEPNVQGGTFTLNVVPEPVSLTLVATCIGLAGLRRRRKNN